MTIIISLTSSIKRMMETPAAGAAGAAGAAITKD